FGLATWAARRFHRLPMFLGADDWTQIGRACSLLPRSAQLTNERRGIPPRFKSARQHVGSLVSTRLYCRLTDHHGHEGPALPFRSGNQIESGRACVARLHTVRAIEAHDEIVVIVEGLRSRL